MSTKKKVDYIEAQEANPEVDNSEYIVINHQDYLPIKIPMLFIISFSVFSDALTGAS